MFPYADPQSRLDQHRQRAAELAGEATAHRVAREARGARRMRRGRHTARAAVDPVRSPIVT